MEEQILRLIYDYSKNRRLVDRKYIDKVIDISVNSLGLHHYVKSTEFLTDEDLKKRGKQKNCIQLVNQSDFADLSYNKKKCCITVYVDRILKIYNNLDKENFDNYELPYFKTVSYTDRILHELEHADQEKTKKEKNNLEAKILCLSEYGNTVDKSSKEKAIEDMTSIITSYIYYILNYEYAPHERLAEINSLKKCYLFF